MSFDDHLASLDEAVAAELGTAASLRPAAGGDEVACRVILERPTNVETLVDGQVVKGRPTIEVSVAEVERLRKGDVVELAGHLWEIASAPSRPGDGRWWVADVSDRGAA